jgi:hypothetical protein
MQLYTVYLYLETALHVSGGTSTHHQERIQLYLLHLVSVTPLLLSAAINLLELVRHTGQHSEWMCTDSKTVKDSIFLDLTTIEDRTTQLSRNNYENNQQDALHRLIYYSKSALHGDWMELAQDKDRWRAPVGTVRYFRVP